MRAERLRYAVGSRVPLHCLYVLWRFEHVREQVRASQAGHRYLGGAALQKGQSSESRVVSVVGVIGAGDGCEVDIVS